VASPEDIEVTPELRRAVYSADCKKLGHVLDVKVAYGEQEDPDVLAGRPDGRDEIWELPYVYCRRCQRVWMILADSPADSYEDAEQAIAARLPDGDSLIKRAERQKERRWRKRERELRDGAH
jgi:hypothetical protein